MEMIQTCLLIGASLSFFKLILLIMINALMGYEIGEKEYKRSITMIILCGAIFLFCGLSAFLLNLLI